MSFAHGSKYDDTTHGRFFRSMDDRVQEAEDYPDKEKTKIAVSKSYREKNPLKRLQTIQKIKRGM
jgi:hypothetical protein